MYHRYKLLAKNLLRTGQMNTCTKREENTQFGITSSNRWFTRTNGVKNLGVGAG
jgi:hypothetical protein